LSLALVTLSKISRLNGNVKGFRKKKSNLFVSLVIRLIWRFGEVTEALEGSAAEPAFKSIKSKVKNNTVVRDYQKINYPIVGCAGKPALGNRERA
jgi:hypothetical protein